jgi:hypothetical protein
MIGLLFVITIIKWVEQKKVVWKVLILQRILNLQSTCSHLIIIRNSSASVKL